MTTYLPKVKMTPSPHAPESIGGVDTVMREYARVLEGRVEWVDDVQPVAEIVHAGVKPFDNPGGNNIAMLHGLYWTGGNVPHLPYYYGANAEMVASIRRAKLVTVPSEWVAQTLRREARIDPMIIPHGVDRERWAPRGLNDGFVLWAKNRISDVCSPAIVHHLAELLPDIQFITTFAEPGLPVPDNMTVLNRVLNSDEIVDMVARCSILMSSTQETFGILPLEALSMGKPVLTGNHGNVPDLIRKNLAGYCAQVDDAESYARGVRWILDRYEILSQNAEKIAAKYTWEQAGELVLEAIERVSAPRTRYISVVIPVHNKQDTVMRAIQSVADQDIEGAQIDIIVVDDSSEDDSYSIAANASMEIVDGPGRDNIHIRVHSVDYRNVALTRNYGAWCAVPETDYLLFLDADDWIDKTYLSNTVPALEQDNGIHIAYTRLTAHMNNEEFVSAWPPSDPDFTKQVEGRNQIPTCCLIRAESFRRSGGYRARYAPTGAGSEDAHLWLMMGSVGKWAINTSSAGLFHYSGGGHTSNNYKETPWAVNYPFIQGNLIPFMSMQPAAWHSHPVRPYDRPIVSIIIPVGPGHETSVQNALDSIEWQTLSNWEVIVVWNSDLGPDGWLTSGYPYAKWLRLKQSNVSAARNAGVKAATAPLVTFLDADDYLLPDFLNRTVPLALSGKIVYTDYIGKYAADRRPDLPDLIHWDERLKIANFYGRMEPYDKERALLQPQNPPYVWSAVNMVLPKRYHTEAGGFNESLESWEDWHYQIKLARSNHEFVRVPEPLFVYDFDGGYRRKNGLEKFQDMGLFDKIREAL